MELIVSTEVEFKSIFPSPFHIFNDSYFSKINEYKCDKVIYLIFKDNKYRLGLIAGIRNNILESPFSAPFGGFTFIKEDVKIEIIEKAEFLLYNYCKRNNISAINIILQPLFYSQIFLSKYINVLFRNNYQITNVELDYYFELDKVDNYIDSIWYNAKKNLLIAKKNNLTFDKVNDLVSVYEIIKQNRLSNNKPLNMTIENIKETMNVVSTDLFVCKLENTPIASSIAFIVNENTVYIPFWGDQPGFKNQKPMNFLSANIFEYYKGLGYMYLHIGISTEKSVPNYGLCDFKESIGSNITPKFMFSKSIL